jgi:hypothetical protein
MNSTGKSNEIVQILKGLRRIDMSKREAHELADIVIALGKGSASYHDEIADVISRLEKVKMSKWEAKEVASIMINLCKTKYEKHGTEEEPQEMINLRKVVANEKIDEIADILQRFKKIEMSEHEAGQFIDIAAELRADEVEQEQETQPGPESLVQEGTTKAETTSPDHTLVTVEYDEGGPQMIVHVPLGDHAEMLDEGLEISEHWDRGVSMHGEQAPVKGGANDDESDIYEEASLEEESEPREAPMTTQETVNEKAGDDESIEEAAADESHAYEEANVEEEPEPKEAPMPTQEPVKEEAEDDESIEEVIADESDYEEASVEGDSEPKEAKVSKLAAMLIVVAEII